MGIKTELQSNNVDLKKILEMLGVVFPEADTLDGCSWENISKIAASGKASNYFAVGDTKKVVLNGTVGTLSLDNYETYVYIIGFDHNGATNTIDFGTFKTANGIDVGLYVIGGTTTDGTLNFNINHWGSYNYGGWAGCDLRYDMLGSTDTPPSGYGAAAVKGRVGYDASSTCATSPVANTLMAALPSELRNVMKPMTIYTDNVAGGNSNVEANVTTTVDYLPLLAEFEIFGSRTNANSAEQNYQTWYTYYANGNSKIKYRHTYESASCNWSTRSMQNNNVMSVCRINDSGTPDITGANANQALAPIFRV